MGGGVVVTVFFWGKIIPNELLVLSTPAQQLLMRAHIDDRVIIHHYDTVSVHDCAQAVRDHDDRTSDLRGEGGLGWVVGAWRITGGIRATPAHHTPWLSRSRLEQGVRSRHP